MPLWLKNMPDLQTQLKCSKCNKMLSVFPVYHCSAMGHVCGRCSTEVNWMVQSGLLERAVAYESVAKFMIFPCSNKNNGCKVELTYDQVEEHEKYCNSDEIACPFNPEMCGNVVKCPWSGGILDLRVHLVLAHNSDVRENPATFIIDIQESSTHLFVLTVGGVPFVAVTKYLQETKRLQCCVMCCSVAPEEHLYRYQLELGRSNDYFLILRKAHTENISHPIIQNSSRMITADLAALTYMVRSEIAQIFCKLVIVKKDRDEVKGLLSQLTVVVDTKTDIDTSPTLCDVKAQISQPGSKDNPDRNPPALVESSQRTLMLKEEPTTTKQLSLMDKERLHELACPVCFHYMVPPIYICPTGHSICSECKDKVKECPSCRAEIGSVRNHTLEHVTTRVEYSCKYVDMGCNEILTSQYIREHETTCSVVNSTCPLKMLPSMCNDKNDSQDILNHIREKHAGYLVEANREYSRKIKALISTSYHVAIHENEVFIICCKHSATMGPIKFNFVHMGMRQNRRKFRYELEFIDQTNHGMKLIINQLCQPLPHSISAALKHCLMIPMEMLEPFICKKNQPTLYFKFRIENLFDSRI